VLEGGRFYVLRMFEVGGGFPVVRRYGRQMASYVSNEIIAQRK
jgi:hypothetical protein